MSTVPTEGTSLIEAASRFGTPTYVYSESRIKGQIDHFRTAFRRNRVRLLYAMKANSNPWILRTVISESVGIDAVSPAEAVLAVKCGAAPESVFYSANNCSDDELDWASEQGYCVNIGEPARIASYCERHPGTRISIRVNLNVGAGHHDHVVTGGEKSKFGIPPAGLQAAVDVARRHNVRLCGLHQHIGSGSTDAEELASGIIAVASVAATIPGLEFVNMGGGFGVAYRPDQGDLDLNRVAALTAGALQDLSAAGIEAWFEPGRFLVAEAGVLLVRVTSIKQTAKRTFVGTDSGMNHLIRPSLYGAYHGVYNLSNPDGDLRVYDVVGNICETGDFFARDRDVPEVREGDLLAILDSGAYAYSMSSLYNLRALPAEVAIRTNGELLALTRRIGPEELADQLLAGDLTLRP